MQLGLRIALLVAGAAMPLFVALCPSRADATATYESPYGVEQTFGTALRLLRVDLGCALTEKDAANGYVLFEYKSPESGDRVHRGSVEIVKGAKATLVTVQLPALPQYHEQMVVDLLAKKLATEHGAPPPRPRPTADAGPDASP